MLLVKGKPGRLEEWWKIEASQQDAEEKEYRGQPQDPNSSQDQYTHGSPSNIYDEELMVLWLTILKISDAVLRPKLASFHRWNASIVDYPEMHHATKIRAYILLGTFF
jgi:hypothetical protein